MNQAHLKAAALAEVNRLRAERNLPTLAALPTGIRNSARCCPVANALSNGVKARFFPGCGLHIGDEELEPPDLLTEFAYAFDNGEFPELVA